AAAPNISISVTKTLFLPAFRDMENISYHVAAGKIDKDLLKEIICAVIEDDMAREGLKLKILMAISD
ncbi:MAG: hypothetical protein QME06_04365, partial [Desulfobacterales bacterium]|nr:hypothetical protein [Desulfobacterales bacterium]